MKIKWKVQPRLFNVKRGWPFAECTDTHSSIFSIICSTDYSPKKAKNVWHQPLKLQFADRTGKESGFTWRTLNYEFLTLDELKKTAQMFADKNPHLFMNEGQET
jgi:hypothetical protein